MQKIIICNIDEGRLDVDVHFGVNRNNDLYNLDKGYTPAQGDSIFLMPGVNIPRVKLKDLALNLGIKVVRDPERANIIISGKATFDKITLGSWKYKVDINNFTQYVELLKTIDNVDNYYINQYETAIAAVNPDVIYTDYGTISDMNDKDIDGCTGGSKTIFYIDSENAEIIDAIQNKTIFDESELLAMINGDDAIIITKEVYQQLTSMFDSKDSDNHIMAMEIMANSKYIESALYLLLLLEGNSSEISDSNTRNHVNFKSMVTYFGLEVKALHYQDPDRIAKKLIEYNLLTKEWSHILLQERADWFIRNISYSSTFSVGQIVPTPAVQTAINDSYTGIIEYCEDSKDVVSVTELNILPERIIESEEEERVAAALYAEKLEEDQAIEEVFTRIERKELKSELIALEDDLNQLPAPPDEIIIELEPVSNNNQIETNESTDIDWF